MFVVQALYPFSSVVMKQPGQQKKEKQTNNNNQQYGQNHQQKYEGGQDGQQKKQKLKSNQNLQQIGEKQQKTQQKLNHAQQSSQLNYLTFNKDQKILVIQAYENGWWYGHTVKNPEIQGFFPSNYVQIVGQQKEKSKPPPPPPTQQLPSQEQNLPLYDPNDQDNVDWVKNQLKNINQGPLQSSYYLGIKGYKNVKIDDKNQNILKGDHVKFDVSTGLAKIPVKDQAPAAKAVRQMGYYFDYHQWCQQRNKQPHHYKSRPDAKRKKIKKLNLKGMK